MTDTDTARILKELQELRDKNNHTCPSCGYCPNCGKPSPYINPYQPVNPYNPSTAPWNPPFVTWCSTSTG